MSDPITNLHYTSGANLVNGQYVPAADGFNLADVNSLDQLNSLPSGVKGLVYLNMTGGATAAFQSAVSLYIGNPKLYGFYLVDEPDPSLVPAANLKSEADWIHAQLPGAITFTVLLNLGTPTNPTYLNTYNSANTDIDLFGLDPYPIRPQFTNGVNYTIIPAAVNAAEAAGIAQSQIVPVYQAFGDSASYTLPTASQEQQILTTWGSVVPTPAFDYAYSWGSQNGSLSLSGTPALQQIFAIHNQPVSNTTVLNSVIEAPAVGISNIGNVVTITIGFSGTATVSGAPTLSLNDNGTATYVGGSGTNALVFSYQVASSDIDVSSLAVTSVNLNGGTIHDAIGNNANLSLNAVTQGGPQIVTTVAKDQSLFSGISDLTNYPPHNALAVGPNNIVMAEGSRIEWTDLTGGSATTQSVYAFFGSLGTTATNSLFDARAAYDSVNHRYVVTMDNIGSGGTISNVDIAVSKDSNPADGWYFSSLNTSVTINGQLTASDQPAVAVDGTNIYITTPQYNVNTSGWQGTELWVIGDTAGAGGGIYNGGTLTVAANQVALPGGSIFKVAAGNNGKSYYAGAYSTGDHTVVTVQTYDLGTNTFGTASTIALGNNDQGNGGAELTAQQQGTNLLLDAGDSTLQSLAYAGGYLYGLSEVKPFGSGVPELHWFKLDVSNPNNPIVVAQGDVSGAAIGTNVATFDGSIAVDGAGDAIINFTASGPNMYPADYYVYHGAADPTGSFGAPVLYQASTGFFNSGNGAGTQDWGTRSSAIADPNNPHSFWVSGEYVANGWWQTSAAQVAVQTVTAIIAPVVSSIAASGPGITGGNGDLNAGKVVTLTVNFSAPVIVNTTGGSPMLSLNDGGSATYAGGSGTSALTFSYTVAAGQNTPDLVVSALSLNGATIQGAAANNADLSGATNSNPAGILQIDTTSPVVTITSMGGSVNQATQTVTGTVTDADGGTTGTTVTLFDGTAQAGTATVQADGSWSASVTLVNGTNTLTAKDTDPAGNTGTSNGVTYTLTSPAPVVSSIATSGPGITGGNGDLNAGKVVTLTVNFSAPVTVNTTGGSPMLSLNDGGSASYAGGSGTSALTFSYTVAVGQNTPDLTVSALSLNGATIQDAAANNADLSGATNSNPAGILQIDTTSPVVTITSMGGSVNQATQTVTGTVTDADGGTTGTTVTLFDGTAQAGTATVQADGSWNASVTLVNGTNTLTAKDTDPAGNTGTSNGVTYTLTSPAPVVSSIATSGPGISGGNGDLNAGKVVTLTVNFSAPVTVNTTGGSPTLSLNDGGSATYAGGSGTSALTFSYTVAAGQNSPDLTVSALTLNGATIQDAAATNADLSGATNSNPAGILQIDTTSPVVTITSMGGSVNQATQTLTGTVTDADGGTTGTTVTLFDGTAQAGTATVQADGSWSASVTLVNGTNTLTAKDTDPAGNTGTSNGVTYTLTSPAPVVSSIATSGPGISGGNGDLNAGKVVTLTVNFSAPVTVNTTGGSPTLSLNDGGSATYAGGSGTSALTFSYTVAAGQNTPDLTVSALTLNGATIQDAAATNADLSGATNSNPAGILQIDTTSPTLAIATIASNNVINASTASAGFAISGTSTDAENGQIVTVNIANSSNTVVDSYTTTDQGNAWSVNVTSAQATALADGRYTVTANVADQAGNAAPQASGALTVDEDKAAEAPALTIANTALTVPAGGSVPLGITATQLDSDDRLTVTISGVPKYESITAPSGDSVTSKRLSNGTYTWTITENAGAAGTPLAGLMLKSSYAGSGHPIATFRVTASNATSGETGTSTARSITVTDPPATTSATSLNSVAPDLDAAAATSPASVCRLAMVFNQFMAAGFQNDQNAAGQMTSLPQISSSLEDLAFLSRPHHSA
ncbi:hypothetical protein SAMN05519103_00037 [Rhizobiales bacterium GAS113]|nr:hypothetical protein SAMN05519103_00037 [Rhizobiales bacterium GAS113]